MIDYSEIKVVQDDVWEVVDQKGDSVFSTHCKECGGQFFFGDLRLLNYLVVCQPCKAIKLSPIMEAREEMIQPTARQSVKLVYCKNFEKCGEMMLRAYDYRINATCYKCKQVERQIRDKSYEKVRAN
jgi:hypothetical protein